MYHIIFWIYKKYKSKTFLDFINDNSVKNNNEIKINNVENILLEKKNEEYKDKINKLEKYIKELESKIKEKDLLINEVNKKNENLNQKIKEITNDIIGLKNEINLFKLYYNFAEGEKLIKINFISSGQDIDYSMITKNTENFSKLEITLYQKYPRYLDSENYFIVNGNKINRNRTLEQNKIKNNDVITLLINNFD